MLSRMSYSEPAKVTKNISIDFSEVWIKLVICDCFACLSIKQTLILNMLKEHPAFSFSLPSLQPCTFHGCFFVLHLLVFPLSLWGMRKAPLHPTSFWLLNRGSQAWSLTMPKSWMPLEENSMDLKPEILLFVSPSL